MLARAASWTASSRFSRKLGGRVSILAVKGDVVVRILPVDRIADAGVLLWNGLSHDEMS